MSDLYDQHIDAMKAREREDLPSIKVSVAHAIQSGWQHKRNAERLAAYKRKRADDWITDAKRQMAKDNESADELKARIWRLLSLLGKRAKA